jgi:hypothetical protein
MFKALGYKFRFVHQNVTGFVHVFPAGAIVRWAGMDFQSDAVRGELASDILQARILAKRTGTCIPINSL